MEREIPTGNYDYCVLGESLFNHYIAAVLSSKGYKVIVLDNYEIGKSTFNSLSFVEMMKKVTENEINPYFLNFKYKHKNCLEKYFDNPPKNSSKATIESAARVSNDSDSARFNDILNLSKKFCIDFFPFLIPTAGPTVQSIIDFDVSYHLSVFSPSFKCFYEKKNKFCCVPLNRNQVFTSDYLSYEEKYFFTKFVNTFLGAKEEEDCDLESLYSQYNITGILKHFLVFSVVMDWNGIPRKRYTKNYFIRRLSETFEAVKKFNTHAKYLISINGSQDLSHCFLRKASVMGAITCYGIPVRKIRKKRQLYELYFDEKNFISSNFIIMDHSYNFLFDEGRSAIKRMFYDTIYFSHCIVITTQKSFSESPIEDNSSSFEFLVIPDEIKNHHVWIIKFGSGQMCPIGTNLIYFSCYKRHDKPHFDLSPAVYTYIDKYKVKVLWSFYYNSRHSKPDKSYVHLSELHYNVILTNSLIGSQLSDAVIEKANDLLKELREPSSKSNNDYVEVFVD